MGSTILIVFEAVTLGILFLTAAHLGKQALSSRTGPTSRSGYKVKNYSGMMEGDVIAVLINLMMSVSYFGGLMETISDNHHGLFHTYKFLPYLFTCPMIMWDLIYSTGGLYRTPIAALTWIDLLIAFLADIAEDSVRWAWFGFGCSLYLVLIYLLCGIASRSWKICSNLSEKSRFENEEMGMTPGSHISSPGGDRHRSARDLAATPGPYMRRGEAVDRRWEMEEHMQEQYRQMKKARLYIAGAISLMFVVWPIFPVVFVLRYTNVITDEVMIIIFCCLDLTTKSVHTYLVEKYRGIMLDRLARYGFLSPDILRKIDADSDVAEQLRQLAIARDNKKANKTLAWVGSHTRPTIVPLRDMARVTRTSLRDLAQNPAVSSERLRLSVLEIAESLRPMENFLDEGERTGSQDSISLTLLPRRETAAQNHEKKWAQYSTPNKSSNLADVPMPGAALRSSHSSWTYTEDGDGNEAQFFATDGVGDSSKYPVHPRRAPAGSPKSTGSIGNEKIKWPSAAV